MSKRYAKLLYVAGPFSPNDVCPSVAYNVGVACEVGRRYLMLGHSVFVPHAAFGWIAQEPEHPEWDEMMEHCLEILSRCDGIVMCPRWEHSKGARIEHALARKKGLPVMYEITP